MIPTIRRGYEIYYEHTSSGERPLIDYRVPRGGGPSPEGKTINISTLNIETIQHSLKFRIELDRYNSSPHGLYNQAQLEFVPVIANLAAISADKRYPELGSSVCPRLNIHKLLRTQ